jgi:GMP synthase PP-ATPase subunit
MMTLEDQIEEDGEEFCRMCDGLIEHDKVRLQKLAIEVDKILRRELKSSAIECDFCEARIYNVKTVGVQGDNRTYCHPAEITIINPKSDNFDEFLDGLSTKITNEVSGVNRVVYVTGDRKERL